MIRLGITFLTGRYHATPWDRHVNEGVTEWPPAPLRVQRALAAALFERRPDLSRERALGVLCRLSALPRYTVPAVVCEGHTRHYLSKNELEQTATAMAFDAFVVVRSPGLGGPDVVLWWDVELSAEEREILEALSGEVSYLGRAESWCQLRLLGADERVEPPNCAPLEGAAVGGRARLLCAEAGLSPEQLVQQTDVVRQQGYAQAPGTRWVTYGLPMSGRSREVGVMAEAVPEVAEFALGGRVLPPLTEAVRVGEMFRRAALSLHGEPSQTLSGHAGEGAARDGHRHAHYVPECRDGSGRVTHVVVYASAGFTPSEQRALSELRYLPWRYYEANKGGWIRRRTRYLAGELSHVPSQAERVGSGAGSLDVVLCGFGRREELGARSRLFGEGTVWCSRTPFILPRHIRRSREQDRPVEQVRQELARRSEALAAQLLEVSEVGGTELGGQVVDWWRFRRHRPGHPVTTGSGGFKLRFSQNVAGPLLLGAGSHFGMGQFIRDDSERPTHSL